MNIGSFSIIDKKIIIRIHDRICETEEELVLSALFQEIIQGALGQLRKRNSYLLNIFGKTEIAPQDIKTLTEVLRFLTKMPGHSIPSVVPQGAVFLRDPNLLNDFVEYLYNYWRSFDRFVISDSTGKDLDKKPYRTFSMTIGQLTNLIRGAYRDIQENITGKHPRIYRQVAAGAEISTISVQKNIPFPAPVYEKLNQIPVIRQILLYPPLILNPPMNKRTGRFERVAQNPLDLIDVKKEEWLCYPAKVGSLIIFIYFHNKFSDLGHSLCNLFQLAEDEDLTRKPDAVFVFGAEENALDSLSSFPTVFYDDEKNGLLSAAIPRRDEFGYFGYLKKMTLTLHNIIMMKKGRWPFHGALVRMFLQGGREAVILFVGDTGAGKSETLEALRGIAEDTVQDLMIIADDMGSLEITAEGKILGYGTETGAFLRLDDLQPGYALGQIDRAIIMSPNQVNARIVLPVTTFENIIAGWKIDFVLYANNYEDIDEDHPLLERFESVDKAFSVFKEGTVMSKGTTTSTGIVHSYFANVFGPPQYKHLHEPLARRFFEAFFEKGIFVGQMRTRLGIPGWERKGPEHAAKELLQKILHKTP